MPVDSNSWLFVDPGYHPEDRFRDFGINLRAEIVRCLGGAIVESFHRTAVFATTRGDTTHVIEERICLDIQESTIRMRFQHLELQRQVNLTVNIDGELQVFFTLVEEMLLDQYHWRDIFAYIVSEIKAHIDAKCLEDNLSFRENNLPNINYSPFDFTDIAWDLTSKPEQEHPKALALLKSCLTHTQLQQYEDNEWFLVQGNESGRVYQINRYLQMNVYAYTDGERGTKYCAVPVDHVPIEDHLLAQKLMIETEEEEFLRIAIKWE